MHCSRMRAVRSLPCGGSVQGGLCLGVLCPGGLCLGVSVHGGSLSGGLCLGIFVQGGLCPKGVFPSGDLPGQRPLPPVKRMTDMSKNITLSQTPFVGGKNCSLSH